MQHTPGSSSSLSREYPDCLTTLSSRLKALFEVIVRPLCRAKSLVFRRYSSSSSGRNARSTFPTPVQLTSRRRPIHEASLTNPGASTFSMITASSRSSTAMCTVSPLSCIRERKKGLASSRRSRFSRALRLRLTNCRPKQYLPVLAFFCRNPLRSRVDRIRWAELFGIPSLRPISEVEYPRFAWPRHSSTESARSIDGTEYSLSLATMDLTVKGENSSNQVDISTNVPKIRFDRSIGQFKKDASYRLSSNGVQPIGQRLNHQKRNRLTTMQPASYSSQPLLNESHVDRLLAKLYRSPTITCVIFTEGASALMESISKSLYKSRQKSSGAERRGTGLSSK